MENLKTDNNRKTGGEIKRGRVTVERKKMSVSQAPFINVKRGPVGLFKDLSYMLSNDADQS